MRSVGGDALGGGFVLNYRRERYCAGNQDERDNKTAEGWKGHGSPRGSTIAQRGRDVNAWAGGAGFRKFKTTKVTKVHEGIHHRGTQGFASNSYCEGLLQAG